MDTEIYVYDWKSFEITERNNYHTELRSYGLNKEGKTVCLKIRDFKVRLTIEFTDNEYLLKNFSYVKSKICSLIYNKLDHSSVNLVYKRRLYGASVEEDTNEHKKYPFVEVYFTSKIAMYSFRKRYASLNFPCELKLHEINVKPEIQFVVERDVTICGWITVKNAVESNVKISTCDYEYDVCKHQIIKSNETRLVNAKILSWDIEAKVKNIAKNPGTDVDDCVFQISCVTVETMSNKIKKVLLTLGECEPFDNETQIRSYPSERDLIMGFSMYIKEEKPNILTGWNLFNFDIPFLVNRAERTMCLNKLTNYGFAGDGEITKLKWSSKAFSTTNIMYVLTEGVITVDLIEVVRKDYKLDNYSLNNVSKHFLNSCKDDISLQYMFNAYDAYKRGDSDHGKLLSKVGKYCVQDSKLVADLFLHLKTWLSLCEMANTTSTPFINVHINGQQQKFFNQVYRFCYNNNIIVESDAYKSKNTDRYAGAYVFDPEPGIYEYVIPLDFASLYPSIIEAYNLDYTTLVMNDANIDDDKLTILEWEDHIGCIHDPLVIKKNTLTSVINSTTNKNLKKKLTSERSEITKKINKNPMCQSNKFKFLKQEIFGKGVIPTIIENLLDKRRKVRKEMKSITDPGLLAIMNQRQLSYKVSANSMYGATGVKTGALPLMPLAMCVTYIGRNSVKKAADDLKNIHGGFIVYGDTDSNYVTFKVDGKDHYEKCKALWKKATKTAKEISSTFPSPMKIEFEEVIYKNFMILTKKRYMYYACDEFGNVSDKIGQKGVLLARRDTCNFVKNIYRQTVVDIFNGKNQFETMMNITHNIEELLNGSIPVEDLVISKSINDYDNCKITYSDSDKKHRMGSYVVKMPSTLLLGEQLKHFCTTSLPAQVQLELKMIERGDEKCEGNRLEFVITYKKNALKQCETLESYKYYLQHKSEIILDYAYYIGRLINPLEQIFTSIFKTDNFVYNTLFSFITDFLSKMGETDKDIKKMFPKPKNNDADEIRTIDHFFTNLFDDEDDEM